MLLSAAAAAAIHACCRAFDYFLALFFLIDADAFF